MLKLTRETFELLESMHLPESHLEKLFSYFQSEDEIAWITQHLHHDWVKYLCELTREQAKYVFEIFQRLHQLGFLDWEMDSLLRTFTDDAVVGMLNIFKAEWIHDIARMDTKRAIDLFNVMHNFVDCNFPDDTVELFESRSEYYRSDSYDDETPQQRKERLRIKFIRWMYTNGRLKI